MNPPPPQPPASNDGDLKDVPIQAAPVPQDPKDNPSEPPVLPVSSPNAELENGLKPGVDDLHDVSVDLAAANTEDPPPPPPPVADAVDPYGDESKADIKFKTMTWQQTAFVMIAETVSLGILSLPSTLKAVGLVPGVILMLSLGIIATYTGWVLGQFKLKNPSVHTFAEAGGIVGGKFMYEVCAIGQVLFLVFVMAAHILSFSIMMNVLTNHATCTIVFTIAGMLISLVFSLPRTMGSLSSMSYLSSGSVVAAVFVCMIGVGVRREGTEPNIFHAGIALYEGFGAVTNIIFAYAGHVAFFTLFSEMKRPQDFHKALLTLQISDTLLYTVTAIVIYYYTGDKVTSPALGSTSVLLAKIAYGFAIPTIVIAGIINGHVAVKYIFLRIYDVEMMSSKSAKAKWCWFGVCCALWAIAWVIASAIPVFNNLLGLVSALFLSWFTYGISGWFWLHMNKGSWFKTKWQTFLFCCNVAILPMGCTIMVLGLYSSGMNMSMDSSKACFSCADNSLPELH
ncbi:amino acid transporter [Pyronema omphalodes]|nr:amino acid transporter [Pyronema omphalodes]